MRFITRIRHWLALGLAAALIAAPLTRYVDNGVILAGLAAGTVGLTLTAYGEIYGAVRRETRILRAMHGQRDLLVLANVSLNGVRGAVWTDLRQTGGLVMLGALVVGRLSLGLGLAQYLHLFRVYFPDGVLAQAFNGAFRAVNYISHNGAAQNAGGSWTIDLYQPLWWQRSAALVLLIAILWAETKLMMTLAMAVTLRPRRFQRWAVPISVGYRAVLSGLAVAAITGMMLIPGIHSGGYYYFRSDILCIDTRWVNRGLDMGYYAVEQGTCGDRIYSAQLRRGFEATQLGLSALIDGGALLSANVMRVNLSLTHKGTWLDYRMDTIYGTYAGSYPPRTSFTWYQRVSPALPILRMFAGGLVTISAMLVASLLTFRHVVRRYRPQLS